MIVLLRRELEEMRVSADRKESVIILGIVSIIIILLEWLLGPALFDVYDTDGIAAFIVIIGMVHAGGEVDFSIEEDHAHRQMSFLQTLPIRKNQIVHAKFLNMFLLCGKIFLWIAILISFNQMINSNWELVDLTAALLAASSILLLMAEHLLRYFLWGYRKKGNWLNNISRVIWVVLFMIGFIFMSWSWVLALFILSLIVYGICWRVSIKRIQKRGFPQEVEQLGFTKIEQSAEELKSRQSK